MVRRYPPLLPKEIAYILDKAGLRHEDLTPKLELWLAKQAQLHRGLDTITAKLVTLLTKAGDTRIL